MRGENFWEMRDRRSSCNQGTCYFRCLIVGAFYIWSEAPIMMNAESKKHSKHRCARALFSAHA